ncbi:hypothetical protein HPB50_014144 [Hyalomma asiaticum]|uniref:Uncharacterized protein n=1 Tax=Hyalomma asiaticum TaxID=266040 RepID=A0ACB7RW77_HYAAI|nr:hypothetical protein HPB50_014144 [Hyalomma asiaticum]
MHHTTWGSAHTTMRGRDLLDTIRRAGFARPALNNGKTTFTRPTVTKSTFDDCNMRKLAGDTQGSDH